MKKHLWFFISLFVIFVWWIVSYISYWHYGINFSILCKLNPNCFGYKIEDARFMESTIQVFCLVLSSLIEIIMIIKYNAPKNLN